MMGDEYVFPPEVMVDEVAEITTITKFHDEVGGGIVTDDLIE
jgi:hypothetical protein